MNYFYEAVDISGRVVVGKIEGENETEVQRKLQQLGYRAQAVAPMTDAAAPVTLYLPPSGAAVAGLPSATSSAADTVSHSAPRQTLANGSTRAGNIVVAGNAARVAARNVQTQRPKRPVNPYGVASQDVSKLGGVSKRDLMMFFRQFSSLVHSGISLYGSLENLGPRTRNANLSKTALEMADTARNGGRISDVMARYPRIFPDHVTATVAAGETGGFVDEVLAGITDDFEQNIALYRAAWIPRTMVTQAWFMWPLVQPLFPALLPDAQVGLYLKLVLLRNMPIALALYLLARFAARRLQLPEYRRWRDEMSLKMPPFGDLQRQSAIASFLRMLRRLFHAGVAPIQAWEGAMNTASNVAIRDKLVNSYEIMQKGASLPEAFEATGLFANEVEQLVFTGHESGQVVEMLDRATYYYQEKIEEARSKSKFMMLRLGILGMIVFGGGAMLWLAHSYAHLLTSFMNSE